MAYFLVAFFLIQYVRKALDTAKQLPYWNKLLDYARYFSIALLATYYVADSPDWYNWIWNVFMIVLVVTAYKNEEFAKLRNVIQSVIPFIVVSVW